MIPFVCPVCSLPLTRDSGSYRCGRGHCYDISREGYVNLAVGKSDSGDDAAMCRARHDFLKAGYYRPFADEIADVLAEYGVKTLCDAGCGEGYYGRCVKERLPDIEVIGLDLAKTSVKLGAREERGKSDPIRYAVAGIFSMPLPSSSFDSLISVFAPVPDAEANRILKDGGIMLVCHPGADHLKGLKSILYDAPYDNEEKQTEYSGFTHLTDRRIRYTAAVGGDHVEDLFLMTPYYWRTSREDANKLKGLPKLETELDFIISIYKKRLTRGTPT